MPSAPVVRRFFAHKCTRCGRNLAAGQEVWCRRCADTARRKVSTSRIEPWAERQAFLSSVLAELERINSLDTDDVSVPPCG